MEDKIKFKCIYCDSDSAEEMNLVEVRTIGTYLQHWDFDKNIGCSKNKDNTHPWE